MILELLTRFDHTDIHIQTVQTDFMTAKLLWALLYAVFLKATSAFLILPKTPAHRVGVVGHASVDRRVVFGLIFSGASQALAIQSVRIHTIQLMELVSSLSSSCI